MPEPHPDYRDLPQHPRDSQRPSITCPRCGRTSHHPRDVEEGYCGNCHRWTGISEADGEEESPQAHPLDGIVASVMVVVHPQAGRRILEVSNTGPAGLSREQMIELFELAAQDLRRLPAE